MGMWGWGFLLSPALSGFLSDPLQQYPHFEHWLPSDGDLYIFLQKYPFVLPNLISVLLCVVDLVAVEIWVPETLPAQDLRRPSLMMSDFYKWIISYCRIGIHSDHPSETETLAFQLNETTAQAQLLPITSDVKQARMTHSESVSLLSTSSPYIQPSTVESTNVSNGSVMQREEKATMASLWAKRDTRNHLVLYWIFSFVAISIDEAFPLFCISKTGGLGMTAREIGKLLSATGLIFAVSQYHVYSWIVDKYGLTKSIQIGACLSAPLIAFVPISLGLNNNNNATSDDGDVETNALSWSAFVYLGILLAVCRIFGLVFFSSVTIATNRTVIPSHRGTMNGLSMLGGSFAKGLGPIFAGWLTAFGISSGVFPPKIGAVMVFMVIGSSAAATAVMTLMMLGDKEIQELSTNSSRRDSERSSTLPSISIT
ncbi:MAG: hypothetical protein SGARI_002319 [Bacillariaceae sp.]